jgi:serine/threonine-protein kinase
MANPEDLGRYRLKRLLGRGQLGEVWEANDLEQEGHKVAVKILHAADDELALARLQFAREARLSVHIHHPHIAQVRDAGEAAGTSFMVMDMVEGKPLRAFIGDPTVPLEEKVRWLRQIGDALITMHRADLVHRDLKPENILIRPDRSACLVDLGMYKWTKFELGGERDPAEMIEAMGSEEGDGPDRTYAPPETNEAETYDELGDQWAWGTVAYELITGKLPSPESAPLASLDDVPKQVGDAFDKARATRREDRWDALELALDEIGPGSIPAMKADAAAAVPQKISVSPDSAVPQTQPSASVGPPRALSPMVIGIGILLVLGIVVAVVATLR